MAFLADEAASLSSAFTIHRFTRAESPEQYAQVLQLRTEVFVNEQQVPVEREQDAHEDTATFWLLNDTESGRVVATGRMRPYVDQGQPVAKIERVAVDQRLRGRKLGEAIMRAMLSDIQADGYEATILDAQKAVIGFYEALGFMPEGDEFMDAGIPHRRMRLRF